MNHPIRIQKALRNMPLSMGRAPARPVVRGLSIGGWCVASLLIALVVVGIARWWLG